MRELIDGPMSILQEADAVVNGPRRDAYGDVRESFTKVAAMWSVVFGVTVTASQVAQAMIAFKLCREINKAGYDNRLDLAGYCALLDRLEQKPVDPSATIS
jgi:Domain of unknown function (DUF6378)